MATHRVFKRRFLALAGLLLALILAACQGDAGEEAMAVAVDQPPAVATAEPTEAAASATEPAGPTAADAPPTEPPVENEPEATSAVETEAPTAAPATATPTATPIADSQVSEVSLALVAGGYSRPLYLTHAFDERLFVVEQAGVISIIDGGQRLDEPFLDISGRVGSSALEQGLLGLAFHPDYQQNGRFFVYYTDLRGDVVVAEFGVDPTNPDRADVDSERVLLTVNEPFGNHNGGQLHFGPDGYLYAGLGDGGGAGDTLNQGQDPGTLLGTLLRLDVDGQEPYAIPAGNPFAGGGGNRPEIWAYGLRNPWRFSFDRLTGDLYVADVGQNTWEEVNFQPAGATGGANYGWNVMEANHCFNAQSCDAAAFVAPVTEYAHQGGNCSITGGYVYRGASFPELSGNYFFADYCSGAVWSLFGTPETGWQQQQVLNGGFNVSSFGEDWQGELYLLDHANGDIYQIQP